MLIPLSMVDLFIHTGAALHFFSMAGLMLFGCHRLWLLLCWPKAAGDPPGDPALLSHPPRVTIQLPLYNESRVAGRLIDAAAKIAWPASRIDIQVLDDSTDETKGIVDERAAFWRDRGHAVRVIRRTARRGYKAGALANGLRSARGEFVAVFDADFIPPPDFLEKTIPHFSDPDVGMVQTRWGFLNAGYSWLTRVQALLLSPHFSIEHKVRSRRRLFFNFNGTAGVWRKKAIESSGGWHSDTVTEDLDLSYRAQLAGWRFVYLDSVVVPSELPVTLSGFRGQQQRWSKGSIQTARKILPRIFKARLPFSIKIEAAAHLLANFCWLFGFIATLTLFPLIIYRVEIGPWQILAVDLPVFLLSSGAFLAYYCCFALSSRQKGDLPLLPILPAFSIGLAPSLSLAVIKGFFSTGGYFNRTPKQGLLKKSNPEKIVSRKPQSIPSALFINLVLLIYTMAPLGWAVQRETWGALPFLFLFPLGFLLAIGKDLHEILK
jgi:cellulose synthase/poly-beta-1,6-N-acetylglucosamine synthase-like glycosyltransferase